MTDSAAAARGPEGTELDVGLEAAFGAESSVAPDGSVLAHLTGAGARLAPVLLRADTDDSSNPVRPLDGNARTHEGRYQVVGEVAKGGVGVVLKGYDVDLGRNVAMKVIRDEFQDDPHIVQRFVEEAQIGGQLQHPGIVPVYEIGLRKDHRPYFTMKLVKGKTLSALLSARKHIREGRRRHLSIFESVCQTLAYAHARGVVHRDLKPANIMVGSFGEVLVVDWGMGKVLRRGGVEDERAARARRDETVVTTVRSASEGSQSVVGSVLGTPRYMPPEQARGDLARIDERSDVFGLGAILLEILTGEPPYAGSDKEVLRDAAAARLDEAYARLEASTADAELIRITRTCLAPAMEARFENAGVLGEALGGHLAAVEERAKRAQVAAAEAKTRAAEERARAEREQAEAARERARAGRERAEAEQARKARRLTTSLAASVLLLVGLGVGGWLLLDAQQRRGEREAGRLVADALDEATGLRGRAETTDDVEMWEQASAAAQRAVVLADAGGSPHVRRHATEVAATLLSALGEARLRHAARLRDEALVAEFDRIRSELADDFAWERAALAVRTALEQYGVPTGKTPEVIAASIRASAVRQEIIGALDLWGAYLHNVPERDARILEFVDDDPWRRRLRQAKTRDTLLALAEDPDIESQPVAHRLGLANALFRARDRKHGYELARRTQHSAPADYWAAWTSGVLAARDGDHVSAIRYYTAAIALRPDGHAAYNNRALAYRALGRHTRALADLQRAIALDPDDHRAAANLGDLLRAQGRLEEALVLLERATSKHPDRAHTWAAASTVLYQLGRTDEALAAAREAVRLDPQFPVAWITLAFVLTKTGRTDEALAASQKATQLAPDQASAHNNLAATLINRGDPEGALAAAESAIRLDPRHVNAHVNLGHALRDLGRAEEGLAATRQAVRLAPSDPTVQHGLGRALRAVGELEAAAQAFEEALRLDPSYVQPHSSLSEAYLRLGRVEDALRTVERGLTLDASRAMLHNNRSVALRRLGDAQGAETAIREALRLNPELIAGHCNLATLLRDREAWDAARAAYDRALELDPEYLAALTGLGQLLLMRGDPEAIPVWRRAAQLAPENPLVAVSLGVALLKSGDRAGARDAMRRAFELDPECEPALLNLAMLGDRGDREAALRWAKLSVRHLPEDARAWLALGNARRWTGDLPGAAEAYAKARSLTSDEALRESIDEGAGLVARDVALLPRLDPALAGAAPVTPADRVALTDLAFSLGRYGDVLTLFEVGLREAPTEFDTHLQHYGAACAALQAADGSELDPRERAALRERAHGWLRTALQRLQNSESSKRLAELVHMRRDTDLHGIRDADALARLPADERTLWTAFWADVDALVQKERAEASR